MPKLVTLSVFFPAARSSSAVWAQPNAHHRHSNAVAILVMTPPLGTSILEQREHRRYRVLRCSLLPQARWGAVVVLLWGRSRSDRPASPQSPPEAVRQGWSHT